MTPEALRRRMAHGNVYAAGKVDAALANYFRVGTWPHCGSSRCCGWPTRSTWRWSATARQADHREVGDPRAGRRRADRRPGERDLLRRATRSPNGAARPIDGRARAARRRAGRCPGGATAELRRLAETSGPRSTPSSATAGRPGSPTPARLRARGQRHPARLGHLAAIPTGPGVRPGHRRPGGADSGSIDVHMVTHDEAGRAFRLPPCPGGVGRAPDVRLGAGRLAPVAAPCWVRLSSLIGCPPTWWCSSWPRDRRAGRRLRSACSRRCSAAAAELLPHPAAVLADDRRAGERDHGGGDAAGRGAGGARRRPGGPARPAGRAGARRGALLASFARTVLIGTTAAPAAGEGARGVRAGLGGAAGTAPGRRSRVR